MGYITEEKEKRALGWAWLLRRPLLGQCELLMKELSE